MSDLSLTAMYTSAAWAAGDLPNADLLLTPEAERVFRMVNGALGITRRFTGAPSLDRSLLERHRTIDDLLAKSGAKHVIELAAGLSRRGITFSENPDIHYVEIDLPQMIDSKRKILSATARGREALARPSFEMIAGDIASVDLASIFASSKEPTFVIAEGLLIYLDAKAQNSLFRAISARLRAHGGEFAFDLLPMCEQPKPGVVGRGLGAAMKFFTRGGDFVRDARTRDDIARELREHGFDSVDLLSPCAEQLIFSCRRKSTENPIFSAL